MCVFPTGCLYISHCPVPCPLSPLFNIGILQSNRGQGIEIIVARHRDAFRRDLFAAPKSLQSNLFTIEVLPTSEGTCAFFNISHSLSLSRSLSVSISASLFLSLPLCLFQCVYTALRISSQSLWSLTLCLSVSVCLFVSVSLSLCLSTSVCLSVCLSV